jgi:NAD(P)-dependent dehydrogenase (short-subunit alcohol dehydrogenase family)
MTTLVLTTGGDAFDAVLTGWDAVVVRAPTLEDAGPDWAWAPALQAWREQVAAGPPVDAVVVAMWLDATADTQLVEEPIERWTARLEVPLALWTMALGAAVRRCRDGGTVLAVVDRPAPLDGAGWAPEAAVADGVAALVRSLARAHGPRDVRVNAVTTPARVTSGPVVAPAPPLAGFPGSGRDDVAVAMRMLLSGAPGLTGQILHADYGRSW